MEGKSWRLECHLHGGGGEVLGMGGVLHIDEVMTSGGGVGNVANFNGGVYGQDRMGVVREGGIATYADGVMENGNVQV